MIKFRYILPALLLLILQQEVWAAMYRCVDTSGRVVFTDTFDSDLCTPVVFSERETAYEPGTPYSSRSGNLKRLAAKYDKYIQYFGVRYNVDPHLIRAVIRTESGFNPRAVSDKGAKGLMQLMPQTAKEMQVANPFDPEENIGGGTRYLRHLLTTFKDDLRLALAAYNAGPTIVKKEQNVPRIPETVQYVKRVLGYYRQYKNGTT